MGTKTYITVRFNPISILHWGLYVPDLVLVKSGNLEPYSSSGSLEGSTPWETAYIIQHIALEYSGVWI